MIKLLEILDFNTHTRPRLVGWLIHYTHSQDLYYIINAPISCLFEAVTCKHTSLLLLHSFTATKPHTQMSLRSATVRATGLSHSFRRYVHQTRKTPTNLLDKGPQKYGLMNLQSLKQECRRKGIKVSGRKIDLIGRLVNHDTTAFGAHGISSTATSSAKGDGSSIEFFKFPKPEDDPEPSISVKVPSLSSEASENTDAVVKKLPDESPETYIDTNKDNIVSVGAQSNAEVTQHGMKIGHFFEWKSPSSDSAYKDEPFQPSKERLSERDKVVLASVLGLSLVWWFLPIF